MGTTGLEPAASAVTGQRSNQLNYVPTRQINDMHNRQCLCDFAPCNVVPQALLNGQIASDKTEPLSAPLHWKLTINFIVTASQKTRKARRINQIGEMLSPTRCRLTSRGTNAARDYPTEAELASKSTTLTNKYKLASRNIGHDSCRISGPPRQAPAVPSRPYHPAGTGNKVLDPDHRLIQRSELSRSF